MNPVNSDIKMHILLTVLQTSLHNVLLHPGVQSGTGEPLEK